MRNFIQRVWANYPIPYSVSIWGIAEENRIARQSKCQLGSINSTPSDDYTVSDLVTLCLTELRSDICLNKTLQATGLNTYMPKDTRNIISVKLTPVFQGNRYVKWSYDQGSKICSVRVLPSIIRYSENVTTSNVDQLEGDMLIYTLSYVLWKMADREVTQLTSVRLNADNGEVDLTNLERFRDAQHDKYKELKPEILVYSAST